jgi:hypothetical protein
LLVGGGGGQGGVGDFLLSEGLLVVTSLGLVGVDSGLFGLFVSGGLDQLVDSVKDGVGWGSLGGTG